MRFSFASASVRAFVCFLLVEQVLSASFEGKTAPRFHARLSAHDVPSSPPRVRGWHNGQWGWGGWIFGQRTQPILADYPGFTPLPSWSDVLRSNTSYSRRAVNGSFLPLENIQGDIFIGMRKPVELFFFFHINNATSFKRSLGNQVISLLTSTAVLISAPSTQPLAFMNIAFSQRGLSALGITDDLGDSIFSAGQLSDAPNLGDNVNGDWDAAFKGSRIHGVLLISSDKQGNVNGMLADVLSMFGRSISEVTRLQGAARPGSQAGHEHFGFLDGISNPAVAGFATTVFPGQSTVPAGTILTGRDGDTGTRPSWALDGSFLVFRKLQQLVPEFNNFAVSAANTTKSPQQSVSQGAELVKARMVGRWKSGAPIDLVPLADDPALGGDPNRNNNFDFSHPGFPLNSDQSHCPFSAHIRKTRPRADLGNSDVIHQAIRAGIPYGPELSRGEQNGGVTRQNRGLAFVEYQSTIANGFRFQQQSWANNQFFPIRKNQTVGHDPIIGQAGNDAARTTFGINPLNTSQGFSIPQFIISRGGEYFFSPSLSALKNTIAK